MKRFLGMSLLLMLLAMAYANTSVQPVYQQDDGQTIVLQTHGDCGEFGNYYLFHFDAAMPGEAIVMSAPNFEKDCIVERSYDEPMHIVPLWAVSEPPSNSK